MLPFPIEEEITSLRVTPPLVPIVGQVGAIILSYSDACDLRDYAETQTDPFFYRMAAEAFDALDMPTAAGRMRDRAAHYEVK
jgi:hypothetical protein